MTSRVASLAIDAVDPVALARFWCAALSYEVLETDEEGLISIGAPGRLEIDLVAVPEEHTIKNRLHLDLRAEDRTQAEEVERLLALGARHADVGQGPDVTWVTLADPEGNEFCVLQRTWAEASSAART